jgi:putative membrane protein
MTAARARATCVGSFGQAAQMELWSDSNALERVCDLIFIGAFSLFDSGKDLAMKTLTSRRTALVLASLALTWQSLPALAQSETNASPGSAPGAAPAVRLPVLGSGDRNFLLRAAADELFELEMSRLAVQQASAPDLKAYAGTLVEHHMAVQQELTTLAQAKGLNLPTTLSASRQREINRMQRLAGDDFDRQYFQAVGLRAHRQNIKLFGDAGRMARDPDVRAWANKIMPTQEQHLAEARALPSARRLTYTPMDPNASQTGM